MALRMYDAIESDLNVPLQIATYFKYSVSILPKDFTYEITYPCHYQIHVC